MVRHWWRLLYWGFTRKFEDWRVRPFSDGMWYVEEYHFDHGWIVHPDSASKLRKDAAIWANRYYAKPSKGK